MKLSEIQEMMKEDAKIDISKLESESARIPELHGKWYGILIIETKILDILERDFAKVKRKRYDYYMGRACEEEYIDSPFNYKLTKQEVDIYLDSDDEIQSIKLKVSNQKIKVNTILEFIKNVINSRGFHIKDAIEFIKFKNGMN